MLRVREVLLVILYISTGILSIVSYSNTDLILPLFVSGGLLLGLMWLHWRIENKKKPGKESKKNPSEEDKKRLDE